MIVSSIIANLLVLHRGDHEATRIAVATEHKTITRYDRRGFGQLPQVIESMAALGLIIRREARIKKRRTGIEATGSLLHALLKADLKLSEVGRAEGEETTVLKARMGRNEVGRKLPAEPIDYVDTPETVSMRSDMERLNAFLNAQRIELYGEVQHGFKLYRQFTLRSPDDPHAFNLHGRLYGGFWINLSKDLRRGLRINGEATADLDFSSMFARLAYLKAGVEPPPGDLYAIPGLEEHRGAVKAGLNALLSRASEMERLPPNVKEKLPAMGWTARRFRDAVAAKHPSLVPFFGRDLAMEFMFTESSILVKAMMRLAKNGVPALPMHDGIMIPATAGVQARTTMENAAVELTGHPLPTTIQTFLETET